MTVPILPNDRVRMPIGGLLNGRPVSNETGTVIAVTSTLLRIQWPQGHSTWEPRDQVELIPEPHAAAGVQDASAGKARILAGMALKQTTGWRPICACPDHRDRRLLELLAEPLGWAVIERRYLPLIELAAVREQ